MNNPDERHMDFITASNREMLHSIVCDGDQPMTYRVAAEIELARRGESTFSEGLDVFAGANRQTASKKVLTFISRFFR